MGQLDEVCGMDCQSWGKQIVTWLKVGDRLEGESVRGKELKRWDGMDKNWILNRKTFR